MKPVTIFLAAALSALIATPALASERCIIGSQDVGGAPKTTEIDLDLAGKAKLDPATLPERSSTVMCRRSSIVPGPNDVRVLIELGVAFGIVEQNGPRSLWVWAKAGTLKIDVVKGRLEASEKAALREWREAAQLRFALALAEAGRRPR